MMRDVYLHGHLAVYAGHKIELDCETACEAVRAIGFQIPAFVDALSEGNYMIIRGDDLNRGLYLDIDEAMGLRLGQAALHIVPVIEGSGGGRGNTGAWIKIIAGALLVGAAIFFSGGALGASMGFMGMSYGNLAMIGLTLALLGVSKLLADDDKKKEKQSYSISGPSNTYGQGNPVPVIYGQVMSGSVTVSVGMDIGEGVMPTIGDWVIVGNSGFTDLDAALTLETLRVRIDIEDSVNCGGTNANIQMVVLQKTINVEKGNWKIFVGSIYGAVEEQNASYENMKCFIDDTLFFSSTSWNLSLGCSMSDPQILINQSVTMDKGDHTLRVEFSTGDNQYHKSAFYDITFDMSAV